MAATILRGAFSSRSVLLHRTAPLLRCLSPVAASPTLSDTRPLSNNLNVFDCLGDFRRGYAKGGNKGNKKSKGDDADKIVLPPNFVPDLKASASSQMDLAVVALSRELSKLRTGRANPGMLDHIVVETGGVKAPLNRLAMISVMDPRTLSITPYDSTGLKAINKAIVSSPLGINPKEDGERLIAVIPPLTTEHMRALVKVVSKSCEDVKQSIRRARQKAFDSIKKYGPSLTKDSTKKVEKEVDDITKKFVKSAEDMCKAKEKEITQG